MSGLQHPLESNGGRSIRFMPSAVPGMTGNGGMAAYGASAPHQPPFPPMPAGPPPPLTSSSVLVNAGSTYISAGGAPTPGAQLTVVPSNSQGGSNSQQQQQQHLAEFNRNPLLCFLCNQAFRNPCVLSCYHTFCAACLKGRAVEGKVACPLCG